METQILILSPQHKKDRRTPHPTSNACADFVDSPFPSETRIPRTIVNRLSKHLFRLHFLSCVHPNKVYNETITR
jgi:hypothetical protein